MDDRNDYYCATAHEMAGDRRKKLRKLAASQTGVRQSSTRSGLAGLHEAIYKFAYLSDARRHHDFPVPSRKAAVEK